MKKWGDRENFRQIVLILTKFIEQSFLLVKKLFVISVSEGVSFRKPGSHRYFPRTRYPKIVKLFHFETALPH